MASLVCDPSNFEIIKVMQSRTPSVTLIVARVRLSPSDRVWLKVWARNKASVSQAWLSQCAIPSVLSKRETPGLLGAQVQCVWETDWTERIGGNLVGTTAGDVCLTRLPHKSVFLEEWLQTQSPTSTEEKVTTAFRGLLLQMIWTVEVLERRCISVEPSLETWLVAPSGSESLVLALPEVRFGLAATQPRLLLLDWDFQAFREATEPRLMPCQPSAREYCCAQGYCHLICSRGNLLRLLVDIRKSLRGPPQTQWSEAMLEVISQVEREMRVGIGWAGLWEVPEEWSVCEESPVRSQFLSGALLPCATTKPPATTGCRQPLGLVLSSIFSGLVCSDEPSSTNVYRMPPDECDKDLQENILCIEHLSQTH